MAKRQSVLGQEAGVSRDPMPSTRAARDSSWKHWFLGIGAAGLMLCATATSSFGATGPGLGIKVGAQTLDSPIDGQETTRARFELELSTAMLANDHVDFSLAVGGSLLGTSEFEDIYEEGGVLYEDYYSDSFSIIDVRAAARFYPFGDDLSIRPHVGGGIGYYWFLDSWDDDYYTTMEDPYFPGTFITFADHAEHTDTLEQGFFPFITAGLTVPVTSNIEFLFEFEYDFAKDESGIDLGGPIYMFGVRARF
jgi:outer membrane protein W